MSCVEKAEKAIEDAFPQSNVLTIGIAGGSGSGKSTITEMIVNIAGKDNVNIISSDNYYYDLEDIPEVERAKTNFDHPDSIDFKALSHDIIKLKNFEVIEMPIYDFKSHTRNEEVLLVNPTRIMIVEGILIFAVLEIRNQLNIRFFIDADADERYIRRLARDVDERERSPKDVSEQWRKTVKPMHDQFVEPSKKFAHIILPSRYNESYTTISAVLNPFICFWLKKMAIVCCEY